MQLNACRSVEMSRDFLTRFVNAILKNEERRSVLVPIFKEQG